MRGVGRGVLAGLIVLKATLGALSFDDHASSYHHSIFSDQLSLKPSQSRFGKFYGLDLLQENQVHATKFLFRDKLASSGITIHKNYEARKLIIRKMMGKNWKLFGMSSKESLVRSTKYNVQGGIEVNY